MAAAVIKIEQTISLIVVIKKENKCFVLFLLQLCFGSLAGGQVGVSNHPSATFAIRSHHRRILSQCRCALESVLSDVKNVLRPFLMVWPCLSRD